MIVREWRGRAVRRQWRGEKKKTKFAAKDGTTIIRRATTLHPENGRKSTQSAEENWRGKATSDIANQNAQDIALIMPRVGSNLAPSLGSGIMNIQNSAD